jgi:Ca2+-binding EF-hand superfamily protein
MRSTRQLIPASLAAVLIAAGVSGAAVAQDQSMGMHGMHGGMGLHGGASAMGPNVERMFGMLDADGDGKVTTEEMAAAPQRRFAAIDANADGKVTADEMVEHRIALMRARIEARVAMMITEMDDNGDGALSVEDMGPGRAQGRAPHDADVRPRRRR